ncbi:Ankyrin repeat domain-containing protein 50 isoform 1 [Gossypium australe]|uniref:Ankyrin repeat domain-containing protein 50 isoform 1 n=1 Tax=Gossypium australe TaxID=47621 RepID=A0A5B6UKF0_9ROSI|nr:Ankyrin repeat domain-containing protein 50 isoform 1 [Gossypium australe]
MAGREVREYTNLSDPKGKYENRNLNHKRWGKGKDKLDDEDIAFQRMVAKVRASPLPSFSFLLNLIIIIISWFYGNCVMRTCPHALDLLLWFLLDIDCSNGICTF